MPKPLRIQKYLDKATNEISFRLDGLPICIYITTGRLLVSAKSMTVEIYPSAPSPDPKEDYWGRDHWKITAKDGVKIDKVESHVFDTVNSRHYSSSGESDYFLLDSDDAMTYLFGITWRSNNGMLNTVPLYKYLQYKEKPTDAIPTKAICLDNQVE